MKDILTWIEPGIVEINGEAPFQEVNAELGEYGLPVEPLSAKKTINQFIKEGGIGYNSLRKRTLGSSIFQLSATFSGQKFTYGSKHKTLYNAGYPLHRIMEGPLFSKKLAQNFGRIEKVLLPVRKTEEIEVSFQNDHLDQLHVADRASNVFFMNDFGAELMGLTGEGIVKTYPRSSEEIGKSRNDIWEKRFLEDRIPPNHHTMKFLTMSSGAAEIYKLFSKDAQGLFFALRVHNGVLLLMSAIKGHLDTVSENIRQIPLTFEVA